MWLGKNVSFGWIMARENVGRGKICSLGKICVPNDGGRDGAKEKTL
jgi:hypothetical protein